ncbi:MAG: amidohydrolase family protein [Candidatus Aminicenantes bacterium]
MRKPKLKKILYLLLCTAILCLVSCSRTPQADRIFTNGHIITMNVNMPEAEAFAVEEGFIIALGTNAEMREAYPFAEEVDLDGKDIMPGIIESHGHMLNLGRSEMRVDLQGVNDPREVVQKLRKRVAETTPGEWIDGWGWDDGAWKEQMTAISQELSSVSPDNPVWFAGLHGYNGWANAKALDMAGITKDTPDPEGGKIYKDSETGAPTGILANAAQGMVKRLMPPLTVEQREKAFEIAGEELLKNGLTSVHDARITRKDLDALRSLKAKKKLKVRYYVMLDCTDEELIEPYLQNGPEIDPDNWLTIRCIKIFQDGSLGTRSALMFEPYSDAPDVLGVTTTSQEEIERLTTRSLQAGMQVATHAIGDRSNRITLDAYEAAIRAVPGAKDHRLRIEHAQVVALEDIPRFKELDIVTSMQPPHATSDMPWAEDRVGSKRIKGAYAWRLFLDAGVRVPLNSDFPGETLNPFSGMYAAETRQTPKGKPEGGWYPEQCLKREEVLYAYTVESAYSGFEEHIKGQIAPGRLADFIVISDNILTIPSMALLSLKVERTYIGGRLVYSMNASR